MDCAEIIALSRLGEEIEREFKSSINWSDKHSQIKLIKSIIAMSNIEDGGNIIIGVEQDHNDITYTPAGINPLDLRSFNYDDVKDQVGKYADPSANFSMYSLSCQGKEFLVFNVRTVNTVYFNNIGNRNIRSV
ncbi:MAG TPA: ATP-binding protein [Nitrososphaeraceae archaeon]|nr:ATP-binding protein [Nitrososphaeraceae archaeon]